MEYNTIEEFNFFRDLHPYTEYNWVQSERHDEEFIVQSDTWKVMNDVSNILNASKSDFIFSRHPNYVYALTSSSASTV